MIKKSIFRTRYRVVTDCFAGYEVQYRCWWMPFYMQVNTTNTHATLQGAEAFVEKTANAGRVIKQY